MKKIISILSLLAILVSPLSAIATVKKMATVVNPETGERKQVEVNSPRAFDGGFMLELGYHDDNNLGYTVVTDYTTTTNVPMSTSQDYIPVSSLTTTDGHTLSISDVTKAFLVLEPTSKKKEIVLCEGINSTLMRWTDCTRGLAFYGKSLVSVADNIKTHSSGSTVTMSNAHYVYDQFVNKDDDQTIGGDKTFTGNIDFSEIPTSTTTLPTLDSELASKLYVDTVGAGGFTVLNASTTKGLETYGTAPETVGINASSTGGLEFSSDGALQSKLKEAGGIGSDSSGIFIDGSDPVEFSSTTTISGFLSWLHFGPGTDGDVVLTSDATSTRDMFYRNLTINSGVTLNPNGYRIYVSETLSGPGKIAVNGNNGSNGTAGSNLNVANAGGAGGAGLNTGTIFGSVAGGNGGNGGAYNSDGSAGGSGVSTESINNINGSKGGNGANSTSDAGGAGGNIGTGTLEMCSLKLDSLQPSFSLNSINSAYDLLYYVASATTSGTLLSSSGGSSGGGGGAGYSGSASGGGGGGAGGNGGIIFVAAKTLTNPAFESKGGNGGNGGSSYFSSMNSGGGGGGAGGNGGLIIIVYKNRDLETVTTTGGSGGIGTGANPGTNGANGSAGKYIKINIQ